MCEENLETFISDLLFTKTSLSCHKGIPDVIPRLATPHENTTGEVEHFGAYYIPGVVRALLTTRHFMTLMKKLTLPLCNLGFFRF